MRNITAFTRMPARNWVRLDARQDIKGFNWLETWKAMGPRISHFAIIGHGPQGAYMILLRTNNANFTRNLKAYKRWYASIRVF
jgi:hypothetical protein